MIVKELDPYQAKDRFEQAGREAEEKMAHYLRRAFADDPDILVFNGIRLDVGDDAAQVDHLIVHPYGMIIIESKSVTSRIRVNDQGEWTRWFNGSARGMASPVRQAERQRDFFRSYLRRALAVFADKELAIRVRVAISDSGVIDRRRSTVKDELDCVYKADQIPDQIRTIIQEHKADRRVPAVLLRLQGAIPGVHLGDPLTPIDRERIRSFLLEQHTPLARSTQTEPQRPPTSHESPVAKRSASDAEPVTCTKCHGTNLKLDYYYNYFLRCASCNAATPLVLRCARCGTEHKKILKAQTFSERGALCTKCGKCGMSIPLGSFGGVSP